MSTSDDYHFSQSLTFDGSALRAACILPSNHSDRDKESHRIAAGTDSGRVVIWSMPLGDIQSESPPHPHAVTALCSLPPHYYATGCRDAIVRVFRHETQEIVATLTGHEQPVTSLSPVESKPHLLLSGSWDGTAKLWDVQQQRLIATLSGQENSTSVVGWTEPTEHQTDMIYVATGSAGRTSPQHSRTIVDHAVRIWNVNTSNGMCTLLAHVANDHEGPIRGLTLLDHNTIASCSNDGTVRLRDAHTANTLTTLTFLPINAASSKHSPMLLSVVATTTSGLIVACAEDGHVVVWKNEHTPPQLLLHPCCVWNTTIYSNNGDILTCGEDGILRIWTTDTARIAPEEEQKALQQAANEHFQSGTQPKGPSPEQIAKLPHWDQRLQTRGNSEGQIQLFQRNGAATAAQWSAVSGTWIEVGQVLGMNENAGTIDGVQYDHVLPIEVDQTGGGVAKLQIGYNNGENPFVAAQRFIDAHMLPQFHLNEIADYIQQRVGTETPVIGNSTPVATTGVPMVSYQYLPIPGYKVFGLVDKTAKSTLEKIKSKIQEFGDLTPQELTDLDSLIQVLLASNRYHSSRMSDAELAVVGKILSTFPPSQAFPALDLARLMVLHPDATSKVRKDYWQSVIQQALTMCGTTEQLEGPAVVGIPMLSLRLISNAFKGGQGSMEAVSSCLEAILSVTEGYLNSGNKNIRLSVATVVYNIVHYLYLNSMVDTLATKLIPILDAILSNKSYEGEAIMRALQAMGTLVMTSSLAKQLANTYYLASKVEMIASPHSADVKAAAKEVYHVLQ